jgi:hypothetical protein
MKIVNSSLCSGELMNKKFLVPCNTFEILRDNYGPDWDKPIKENYYVYNKEMVGYWNSGINSSEYREYNQQGVYLKNETESRIRAWFEYDKNIQFKLWKATLKLK